MFDVPADANGQVLTVTPTTVYGGKAVSVLTDSAGNWLTFRGGAGDNAIEIDIPATGSYKVIVAPHGDPDHYMAGDSMANVTLSLGGIDQGTVSFEPLSTATFGGGYATPVVTLAEAAGLTVGVDSYMLVTSWTSPGADAVDLKLTF